MKFKPFDAANNQRQPLGRNIAHFGTLLKYCSVILICCCPLHLVLGSNVIFGAQVSSNSDIFSALHGWFVDRAANLSTGTFVTLLRLSFILFFQTIICSAIVTNGRQSMARGAVLALNYLACLMIVWLVAQIPFERISFSPACLSFILILEIFALIVLPARVSFFLAPREGSRRILSRVIYSMIALTLLIQFLR